MVSHILIEDAQFILLLVVHVILFSSHFSFFFFLSSNMCLQGEKTHVHDETSARARTHTMLYGKWGSSIPLQLHHSTLLEALQVILITSCFFPKPVVLECPCLRVEQNIHFNTMTRWLKGIYLRLNCQIKSFY